ncbi:MAG: hypothetical protein HC902_02415 [Calothrix sp. SM1_5_4]|nr:hypothetical protein [Calothrix sp. SM1_5_4]
MPEVSDLAEVVENICIHKPQDASPAALQAASILEDIHAAHSHGLGFNLIQDPRFQRLHELARS